jgi:hypothetical protein
VEEIKFQLAVMGIVFALIVIANVGEYRQRRKFHKNFRDKVELGLAELNNGNLLTEEQHALRRLERQQSEAITAKNA